MLKKKFDLKEAIDLIKKAFVDYKIPGEPRELYDPIEYILQLGGKRLRPVLVILGADLFNGNPEKSIHAAKAIEIFHNFTLVHDDIMDEAPLRRGKETVHKKWNQNIAILSGDAMMVKSYELFLEGNYKNLSDILKTFNKVAVEVCEGQQFDMNFETQNNVSIEDYINMIRLKTSVLVGGALKIGALCADASRENADLLYDFGENLGIAFQLMDDYLDAFGDPEKFGKQVGGDIISNKKTFLLLKALELDKSGSVQSWINKDKFDANEKIETIKSIYLDLGVDQLTFDKMDYFYNKALNALNNVIVGEEEKEVLKEFAANLMKRTN